MKKVCLVAVLASMIAALPVHAEDPPEVPPEGPQQVMIESRLLETTGPRHEFGVDVFNQDVHAALPGGGAFIQPTSGSVLGLQLTYLYFLSALYVTAQGGYGLGSQTFRSGPPFSQEDELRFKMTMLSLGLGYMAPITRKIGLYSTLQLMYQSVIATQEFAGDEEDGPTYGAIGAAVALGSYYQFAKAWKFRLELYNLYARGAVSEEEAELIEWVKFSCYRAGITRTF